MKLLILSDIHGNLNALNAVLKRAEKRSDIGGCVILGDIVDYGMHSNQVAEIIKALPYKIICNIRGNHEDAIINEDYARFSSDRGRESAKNTRQKLNEATWEYILKVMASSGKAEFEIGGKKCLAVHASLADEYWKSISPDGDLSEYSKYDLVFSGHSHLPHYFERYYKSDNPSTRNKKKTVFINPGSVGQPRNLNNRAQFAIYDTDTEEIGLEKVEYDIEAEQQSFDNSVDEFYKTRLKDGV